MITNDPWTLVDAAARAIGTKEDTIRKWHERSKVPGEQRLPILQNLSKRGLILQLDFFDRLPPHPKVRPRSPPIAGRLPSKAPTVSTGTIRRNR